MANPLGGFLQFVNTGGKNDKINLNTSNFGLGGGTTYSGYNPSNTGTMLDQLSPQERMDFYKSGNFTPDVAKSVLGQGLDPNALRRDFNALTGGNYTGMDLYKYVSGQDNQSILNWGTSVSPNTVEQQSKKWGVNATDWADVYNSIADQNISPQAIAEYTGLEPAQQQGYDFGLPGNFFDLYPRSSSSSSGSQSSWSGINWEGPMASEMLPLLQALPGKLEGQIDEFESTIRPQVESIPGEVDRMQKLATDARNRLYPMADRLVQEAGENYDEALSDKRAMWEMASQIPGMAEQLPGTIQNLYGNLMRDALGPEAFQGTMETMGSRGMLDSSVMSDALSQSRAEVMEDIGNRGYESMLEGLQAQMAAPGMVSQAMSPAWQNLQSAAQTRAQAPTYAAQTMAPAMQMTTDAQDLATRAPGRMSSALSPLLQAQMTMPDILAGLADLDRITRSSGSRRSSSQQSNPLAPYQSILDLINNM